METPTFTAATFYRDPKAALEWLAAAFGFEVTMAIEDNEGDPRNSHYEMAIEGRGRIMIGGEWADWTRSPASSRRGQHPEHPHRPGKRPRRPL